MVRAFIVILKQVGKYAGRYVVRQIFPYNLHGVISWNKGIKSIIKDDKKMKALMQLAKNNVLKKAGKLNYIRELYKYGAKHTLKSIGKNMTPMEVRKVYWFMHETGKALQLKNMTWEKLSKLDNKELAKTLEKFKSYSNNSDKDMKEKEKFLDHTFWFVVSSPESGNFSTLPQYANITKKTYGVPIRGVIGPMTKYYNFDKLGRKHWTIVKQAMTTGNYGREVYSKIRSPLPPSRAILIRELVYNKHR